MSNEFTKTFTAAENIAAHRLVKFNADGKVVLATSGTDAIIGVNNDVDVKAGNVIDVTLLGLAKVQFGGVVTAGNKFTAGTDGKAVAIQDGDNEVGIALSATTADEIVTTLIK